MSVDDDRMRELLHERIEEATLEELMRLLDLIEAVEKAYEEPPPQKEEPS